MARLVRGEFLGLKSIVKNEIQDSYGFTLIESLIALGLGGISILAISAILLNLSKSMSTSQGSTEFNVLMNLVKQKLNTEESCKKSLNLLTAPIPFSHFSPGPAQVQIWNEGAIFIQAGQKHASITITAVNLSLTSSVPLSSLNGINTYQAQLLITGILQQGSLSRNLRNSSSYLILTTDVSNRVVSCAGLGSVSNSGLTLPTCPPYQIYTSMDGVNFECRSAIPSGTVLAFDANNICPPDWSVYTEGAGRFLLGAGTNGTGPNHVFGESAGSTESTLSLQQIPPHNHGVSVDRSNSIGSEHGICAVGSDTGSERWNFDSESVGGGLPHSIMPPYYVVTWCRKN